MNDNIRFALRMWNFVWLNQIRDVCEMLLYYALFIFFFSLSDEMRYSLVMRHVGLVCVHSLAINNRAKVIGAVLILNCEVGREGMWWRAGRRGCESREQIGKQSERQTDRQTDRVMVCS